MDDSQQQGQQPTGPADQQYGQQNPQQQAWRRSPTQWQAGAQGPGAQPQGSPQQVPPQPTGQQWQPYWPAQSWPAPTTSWWTPQGSVTPPSPPMPPPGSPAGQNPAPHGRPRKHRAVPALVAGALVVAAAVGGVGIGHLVWPGTQSASGNPVELSTGSSQNGGSTGNRSASGASGSASETGQGGAGRSESGSSGTDNNGGTNNGKSSNGKSSNGGTNNGGTDNGKGSNGGTNNGGSGSQSGPGSGGYGEWPPELLPGGLLPGPGQWPGNGDSSSPSSGTISSAPGAPDDISGILNKVDDAVVDINVTFEYQQAAGAGTGIVLTSTGEVLTNNHVIDGATSISVTDIGNGKTYRASVVGYDKTDDIAVLQLKNASGLATATIGNADKVSVGDAVVGIGNAGGVGGTPSAAGGSVTALNRSITVGDEMYGTTESLKGLIEVNANIQSGDSGGPLVDERGAVIGVNTAASAQPGRDGSNEGYAIPIHTAMHIAKTIESGTGTSTIHVGPTAALGVLISTADQSATGVQPGRIGGNEQSQTRGALVAGVIGGGAAAKAGLAEGDVITSLGGHPVTSSRHLSTLMSRYHPGQSVKLGWTDTTGHAHSKTITLGTGPAA